MPTKVDSAQENSDENPSQYDNETHTHCITAANLNQSLNGTTSEKCIQNNKKDLEELQEICEETKQHVSEELKEDKHISNGKLKSVSFEDKDLQSTVQIDLSLQFAKPPPPSQTEDDTLEEQLPIYGLSDSSSSQPPPPPNQTDHDDSSAQLYKISNSEESDPSFSQPRPSCQAGFSLTQPSPPSSHKELSLAQPLPSSKLDTKSTNGLKNVVAEKLQAYNLEDETEIDDSDYKAYQRELCEDILSADLFKGIGDSHIYFTQIYSDFIEKMSKLNLLDKTEKEFLALNNNYARIEYILQFDEIKNLKLDIKERKLKSEEHANALEEEYNNCCHTQSLEFLNLGLNLINKSIQLTEGTDKELLAVRLMKRGWVNIMLNKFDEAREDAHTSLHYYSNLSVMWNSAEILGHCYAHIGKHSFAEHFFHQALEGLSESDVSNETKAASAKRISSVFKHVKGRLDLKGGDINCTENLITPKVSYGINRILKCATESVEVKVNNKTGRGLYARREIKPGDVIIVEKPYVSALYRENFETHCNNCFKRFKSSIPCDTCTRVWFCNEKCLKEGKDGFHSKECSVLNLLYEENIGSMGILVFRILLRLTWKNIKLLRLSRKIETRLPDSHPKHMEFNYKEKYLTDYYLTTYKLVTNSHLRDFCDIFKKTIIAVYIKQCLKAVDFFEGDYVGSDDEIFVASLILRHLQNSSCNGYNITEFIVGESYVKDVEILELGGGIYPTISLINHSCNPNVFRYCIGKHCIVRATKVIRKGEQLFDNYGSLFVMLGRESRRATLKKLYQFNCDCIACEENWPLLYENDDNIYVKLACPEENCDQIVEYDGEEKMNCPSCGFSKKHRNLLTEVRSKIIELKRGHDLLKDGHQEEAAACVKYFKMYADKNVIPPAMCLTESEEIFKRCFYTQGNVLQSNRN